MDTLTVVKGRYQIKEVLGRGGMGVVYKAFDSVLRRDVAIKTLLDVSDPAALELFHREYEVLAHINHPNIVEIIDIGEFEIEGSAKPYFIMPLLPGQSLGQLIKTASHRLTVERAVEHHLPNLPGTARRARKRPRASRYQTDQHYRSRR